MQLVFSIKAEEGNYDMAEGGGGVLLRIFGEGMQLGSTNPDPISDQNKTK